MNAPVSAADVPGSPTSLKMGGTSPTWPIVLAFALRMEAKLEANRHKGNREGWLDDSDDALFERLEEEIEELRAAVNSLDGRTYGEAPDEAADVANFAMMLADCAGGVKPDPDLVLVSTRGYEGALQTAKTFRERFMRAEKAIAKARKALRATPATLERRIRDAYSALDWRQR